MKFTLFAPIAILAASVAALPMSSQPASSLAASGQESVPENFYEQFTKRQVKKSAKEFAISRAERFNATTERIDFLKSIPDETFQKMADNDMKLHQATRALWNETVPDMASLPTELPPPPTGAPRFNGTRGGRGGRFGPGGPGGPGFPGGPGGPGGPKDGERPSIRDFFVRMAEHRGASAETIEKLKSTDESEFTGLKDLNTKDKFVKEATLMGLDSKVTFFNSVPQPIYDELDTLKTKTRSAHEDLRNGKVPTL